MEEAVPISGRGETVRDRILQASVTLFSRFGYQKTSAREIARLADVSEVTVFRHFEHKEEIFWSAMETSLRGIQPRMNSVAAKIRSMEVEPALSEILTFMEDISAYNPEIPG